MSFGGYSAFTVDAGNSSLTQTPYSVQVLGFWKKQFFSEQMYSTLQPYKCLRMLCDFAGFVHVYTCPQCPQEDFANHHHFQSLEEKEICKGSRLHMHKHFHHRRNSHLTIQNNKWLQVFDTYSHSQHDLDHCPMRSSQSTHRERASAPTTMAF